MTGAPARGPARRARQLDRARRGRGRGLLSPTARRERGSITVELAFLAPVLLLVFGLIYAYGRVSWANSNLEGGVRDAARVASMARNETDALQAAERAVFDATASVPDCQATLSVELVGSFTPGEAVTINATCSYPLNAVLPGAPGTMSPTSSFTSVLDLHRSVDP